MIPKKNKGADLEGKRGIFFLFGIALSLTAAIYVIQLERGFEKPQPSEPRTYTFNDDFPPRTVQTKEQKEVVKLDKPNPDLPPEIVEDTDPKLEIFELFKNPTEPTEEGLAIIEGPSDLHNIETMDFIVMENIARPFECEGVTDKDEQKDCFNIWIKRYVAQNTKYPEQARQLRMEDVVYVTFLISENGDVEEVTIGRGQYDILNKEAVRVLSSMPKMIPGSQRGRKAKMKMTIPVNFKLDNR